MLLVKVWIILLLICSHQQSLKAQIDTNTVISGIINTYTKVLDVFAGGTDSVKVADITGFHVGDAAMLMQMKSNSYGPVSDPTRPNGERASNSDLGYCGQYEIIKINQILPNSVIVFTT